MTMIVDTLPVFYYGKWWATHLQSFADLVFASERIDVGLKKGKFSHPAWTNEKTGANEEGGDEGEARAVIAIPIQPSFYYDLNTWDYNNRILIVMLVG